MRELWANTSNESFASVLDWWKLINEFLSLHLFTQKPEKRRDSTSSRLKKIWRSPRQTSALSSDSGGESSSRRESKSSLTLQPLPNTKPACSLPLLQIWPSQDSPRSDPDGQSFIFSVLSDDLVSSTRWHNLLGLKYFCSFPRRQDKLIPHLLSNRRHVVVARYMSTIKREIQESIRFRPRLLPLHNNQISQLL